MIVSLELHLGFSTLQILVHSDTPLFLYLSSFKADSIFYYNVRSCENSHYSKARNKNDVAGYQVNISQLLFFFSL